MPRRAKATPEQVCAAYAKLRSLARTASFLGCSYEFARYTLRNAGVQLRSQGRPRAANSRRTERLRRRIAHLTDKELVEAVRLFQLEIKKRKQRNDQAA